MWGKETVLPSREHLTQPLPAPANFNSSAGATCADFRGSGGVAAELSGPAMVVAGARRVTGTGASTPASVLDLDGTSVSCPMPADAELGYFRFAVVADRTFTSVPYEFTEEALECGGGGDAGGDASSTTSSSNTAAGVSLPVSISLALAGSAAAAAAGGSGGVGGYTLGVWALPTSASPGVLLRASGAAPDDTITVEFDGVRFLVRDNFVGAMECPGPPVTLGEWTFVILSHDLVAGRAEVVDP